MQRRPVPLSFGGPLRVFCTSMEDIGSALECGVAGGSLWHILLTCSACIVRVQQCSASTTPGMFKYRTGVVPLQYTLIASEVALQYKRCASVVPVQCRCSPGAASVHYRCSTTSAVRVDYLCSTCAAAV